jgi:hypothetical protein
MGGRSSRTHEEVGMADQVLVMAQPFYTREELLEYHGMDSSMPEPEYEPVGIVRAAFSVAMFVAYARRQYWAVAFMGRMVDAVFR